jgi:hydroxypyruvate reductase
MKKLYDDAGIIIKKSIAENMPQAAVEKALRNRNFSNNIVLIAIGKAAWAMADAAIKTLGSKVKKGIVITKYGHSKGAIKGLEIIEAGHPISDENTILGTRRAVELAVEARDERGEILFLISGGGSALFEKPLDGISLEDIVEINNALLACGADIVEINTIRKRLSAVKAGRFAKLCDPANVFSVVLSDVLGDRLDSIASGPAASDMSTTLDAMAIIKKYELVLKDNVKKHLEQETPKSLDNVETVITGSVSALCESAAMAAAELGYEPIIVCSDMRCEAREAGSILASIARGFGASKYSLKRPCALIFGGETIVYLKGHGKGGRNQEIALSAALGIEGMENTLLFSFGSDGTDGPTDAAGAIVDGTTAAKLRDKGIDISKTLDNNDAWTALNAVNSLIITGATGTNVNDIAALLML